jgi:GDP/UDP-N,N'-diacetylbacillosamine 2-epimerase (hydrolysing)
MKKTVCIITGSRAEWGLFYPLAREMAGRPEEFVLKIVATGSHLSPASGLTSREILQDGFQIDQHVTLDVERSDAEQIGNSVGAAVQGFAGVLHAMTPDLVFLLGDRYETFAAAIACLFLKIPVAHLHGGELTEGSLDDTLRHCITKIASLHLVAAEPYRRRVVQLGEDPDRVSNVGALAIDNIRKTPRLSRQEFEKTAGVALGRRNLLITYHPPTGADQNTVQQEIDCLLGVLAELEDTKLLFTRTNPDIYAKEIVEKIECFVAEDATHRVLFTSLGRVLYLTALSLVDAVVGNSSSGIIEAPALGVPTVNIGDRQKGRVRAPSVIDVCGESDPIRQAISRALSDEFRLACKANKGCPYGDGTAARKIVDIVARTEPLTFRKRFHDVF